MEQNLKAIVNGQPLSTSEYEKKKQHLKAIYNQRQIEWNEEEMDNLALEQMIGQTLLLQEAEKQGIKPTSESIEENLEMIKAQFPTEEEFNQAMESQNMTLEQLRSDISNEISVNGFLEKIITSEEIIVTNEDILAGYEHYKASAGEKAQNLDEIKSQLEQMLKQQKAGQVISKVIEKLKTQSEIEIFTSQQS